MPNKMTCPANMIESLQLHNQEVYDTPLGIPPYGRRDSIEIFVVLKEETGRRFHLKGRLSDATVVELPSTSPLLDSLTGVLGPFCQYTGPLTSGMTLFGNSTFVGSGVTNNQGVHFSQR